MSDMNQRHRISCEIDGVSYSGNYWVAGKILVISTAKGGASHQIESGDIQDQAIKLLRRLACDGKA